MACDSIHSGKNYDYDDDKISLLFDRFYIATYGANMLDQAIGLIYDFQKYDNCPRPAEFNELYGMIDSMYELKLDQYRRQASQGYQCENKEQGGIVYDKLEHKFWFMDFGRPFSEDQFYAKKKPVVVEEGTHRYALLKNFKEKFKSNLVIEDETGKYEEFIDKEFSDLNVETMKRYDIKIGRIGSILTVFDSKIFFKSAHLDYVAYLSYIENVLSYQQSCTKDDAIDG